MVTKSPFVKLDLTWLAKEWENLVGGVEYPTLAFTARALYGITQAFLRGQGKRLGGGGFAKYQAVVILLLVGIITRVIDDAAKDINFPALVRIGFDSVEAADLLLDRANQTFRSQRIRG